MTLDDPYHSPWHTPTALSLPPGTGQLSEHWHSQSSQQFQPLMWPGLGHGLPSYKTIAMSFVFMFSQCILMFQIKEFLRFLACLLGLTFMDLLIQMAKI